jgi:hypothetical protein
MKLSEWLKITKCEKTINKLNEILKDCQTYYGCDDPFICYHDNGFKTVLIIDCGG